MALLHYLWSRAAGANATADSNVNWAEGQAPSSVNDSARNMMASLAGYRDDISGAIVTAGTSTAYTVTSYEVFDTLAHLSGQMIAFTPHATNGASPTLNVDGLGAKAIITSPGVVVQAGVLIAGSPYVALYDNVQTAFILQNFYVNPYNIPLGGGLPFFASTAPNSAFAFPYGQAISRSTYAALFTIFSTQYGAGDGSTTFNLPDLRGRVLAGLDNMGGVAASRLTNSMTPNGVTLGAVGGAESVTVGQANLPNVNFNVSGGTVTATPIVSGVGSPLAVAAGSSPGNLQGGSTATFYGPAAFNTLTINASYSGGVAASGGSGTALNKVPPTMVCNFILRVI